MNRRDFIKAGASAGLFSIVPRFVLGGPQYTAPSDQLTYAVIGTGGMGLWHVRQMPGKLIAVCDVDALHLAEALNIAGEGVKGYSDYRDVLKRQDIDIIHIATPPHWHGIIAMDAVRAGKDVWCEKPMTRTIGEGRKLVETIKTHGSIFRINTWFRFRERFYGFGTPVKPIKKAVENGLFGWPLKVRVNAKTGFAWKFFWSGRTDLKAQWIPQNLDYDFWLGPAPYRDYNAHRVHLSFRGYWDYDGGGLGDMGQHYLDPVQYILDKDHTSPLQIEADAPQAHPDAVGKWRRVWMKYADGCEILLEGEGYENDGPFIEGPKGKLFKNLKSDIPNFQKKLAQLADPKPQLTDFHEAVRKRRKFSLNEQNAHRSATLVNLAKIAVRLGRKLTFDPEKQIFINDAEANKLIDQPMRGPWQIS